MTYQSTLTLKKYGMMGAMALSAGLMANGSAFAGPKLFAFTGSTIVFHASIDATAGGGPDPFTIETFGLPNECLQIAAISETVNPPKLEATLVGPDGTTWQNPDSGGTTLQINAVPVTRGWHILRLSHPNGNAVQALARVFITRTALSACNPVTRPVVPFAPVTRKAGPAPQPWPGGPSSRS